MAVMQNSIIFGGVDSADYGIYIGGEGTFNAPKRDVEMISIPGRNGAFALDKGRFENIEVTYSAFNYETDLATFAQNLSDFRNAICSQKGYQRLTDTFHTDEYRMAAYINGLEIKPIEHNTASTFDIVFDCKPQRFLTSGETAVTVANNGTLTNPTLFESSPLFEVVGYGNINFSEQTVTINNVTYGNIKIANASSTTASSSRTVTLDTSRLNNGDAITLHNAHGAVAHTRKSGYSGLYAEVLSVTSGTGYVNENGTSRRFTLNDITFNYGTSSTVTGNMVIRTAYTHSGQQTSVDSTYSVSAAYNGSTTITITLTFTAPAPYGTGSYDVGCDAIYADSTKSALTTTFIDLELGEAWNVASGEVASLNNAVQLPAKLPTLKPGTNTFTKSNTITSLKVTPRWWKV